MMQHLMIPVRLIHPNPHRDFKRNPICKDQVGKIEESIGRTGFWNNVVVREHPDRPGEYQLAYGHSRLDAVRRVGIKEVVLPVADLSDWDMYCAMVDENETQQTITPQVAFENVEAGITLLEKAFEAVGPAGTAEEFDKELNKGSKGENRVVPCGTTRHQKDHGFEQARNAFSRGEGVGRRFITDYLPFGKLHESVINEILNTHYGQQRAEAKRKQAQAAEDKQKEAQVKQAEAEKKQAEAEAKRKGVETKHQEEEVKRKETETKRKEAEEKQRKAEADKAKVESEKAKTEAKRKEVEAKRKEDEKKRKEDEEKRRKIEADAAEARRKKAEAEAEKHRKDAEKARLDAEKAKADAEKARLEAEKLRAEAKKIGEGSIDEEILTQFGTSRQMTAFAQAVKAAKIPKEHHQSAMEEALREEYSIQSMSAKLQLWWYEASGQQERDRKRIAKEEAVKRFQKQTKEGDFHVFLLKLGEDLRKFTIRVGYAVPTAPYYGNTKHKQSLIKDLEAHISMVQQLIDSLAADESDGGDLPVNGVNGVGSEIDGLKGLPYSEPKEVV